MWWEQSTDVVFTAARYCNEKNFFIMSWGEGC